MKRIDKFKSMNIYELINWLDEYVAFDTAPWMTWYDQTYCKECYAEIIKDEKSLREHECAWCELHGKCKYFQYLEETPDAKQILKLWLESEV